MTSSKPHTNEQNNLGNGNLRFQRPVISIAAPSIELLNKIKETGEVLHSFEIPYSVSIVAGHIATRKTLKYIDELESKGIEVIIACGIGSAHLPGMIASLTSIPVGIPMVSNHLGGIDCLFSMLEMPAGVPVATVGISSAHNAAIIACQILSLKYTHLKEMMKSQSRLEQSLELEDNTIS